MNNIQEYDFFEEFDDPVEGWHSKFMRKRIAEAWVDFLSVKHWTSFITLTFRDETYPDVANRLFQFLVRKLNQELFGRRYMNTIGPCYFSYAKGIEYQRRDVIHFHVLVDRPIHYDLIHRFWNAYAGFAQASPIKSVPNAVEYVTKYASKDGEVDPFFAKKLYTPLIIPKWWMEEEMKSLNEQRNKTDQ